MTNAGLKKKHLKHVADALREARDLMNSGGRHWIKGAERGLVDPSTHEPGATTSYMLSAPGLEPAYCSIGALHEVEAEALAAVTLAEVIDPAAMRERRAEIKDEARNEYRIEREYLVDDCGYTEAEFVEEYLWNRIATEAEQIIIGFNDDTPTTWKDVRDAFTKAAKRLADRARRQETS